MISEKCVHDCLFQACAETGVFGSRDCDLSDLQRSLRRRLMLGSAAASGRIDYSLALGAVVFLYRLFVGVPSQER